VDPLKPIPPPGLTLATSGIKMGGTGKVSNLLQAPSPSHTCQENWSAVKGMPDRMWLPP